MRVSASIELVWQLAGQECIAGEFKEIEPEHFCMALLKFSELPVEEVDKVAAGAEVARELSNEVAAVRAELEDRSIGATGVRRLLRKRKGKGGCEFEGGRMHRSQASRDLFDAAAALADEAGSETLSAIHILEALLTSPTDAMADVLGNAAGSKPPKPSDIPLLAEHGRDLTQLAADGELAQVTDRQAECKALLQNLAHEERKSVLLLSDSKKTVDAIVSALAQTIAAGDIPSSMKRKRIIDVTGIVSGKGDYGVDLMEKLLTEAASAPNVILIAPPLQSSAGDNKSGSWLAMAEVAMTEQKSQLICRIAPEFCEAEHAINWGRIAFTMRLQEKAHDDIPWEL
jgi:ATP-dependent Clp protease ATP-binding subunit ClpA